MGVFDEIFDENYDMEQELAAGEKAGKLPTGTYKVMVTDSAQVEESFGPDGCVEFWFRMEVIDGEREGSRINLYPRLFNPEDKDDYRVKTGRKEFAFICRGCKFTAPPSDSTELHDIPFDLSLELKTAKSGRQYHVIKGANPDGVSTTGNPVEDDSAHPFG